MFERERSFQNHHPYCHTMCHTRLYAPCDKASVDLLTPQKVLLNLSLHPSIDLYLKENFNAFYINNLPFLM